MARPARDEKDRFFEKVCMIPFHECWEWVGSKFRDGYGQFCSREGKTTKAHRISFKIHFGEIPEGMFVCHKCDNKGCVNPNHLFAGSAKDNVQDMIKKKRRYDTSGEGNGQAKLNKQSVKKIRFLYNKGGISQEKISKIYGVSQTLVGRIVTNKIWKENLDE